MRSGPDATVATDRNVPVDVAGVRALLADEVAARRTVDDAADGWATVVWDGIGALVDGGKHLRARLVLCSHEAFGNTRHAAAVRLAAGVEMLHGAFLLHDDLIDGDTVRRGRPNLAGVAREKALLAGADVAVAQRWSEVVAVLAGDLALAVAHHLFATADLPPDLALAVHRTVSRTIGTTVAGELGDVALELHLPIDGTGARSIAAAKTAAYSFACPLVLGAVAAGAPTTVEPHLWAVGERLGIAYQVVNDVREVLVDHGRLSDLKDGKVTTLVERAREMDGWSAVADMWGDPTLDDDGAAILRRFFVESGAVAAEARRVRVLLADAVARSRALPAPAGRVVENVAGTIGDLLDDAVSHGTDRRGGSSPDDESHAR